MVELVEFPGKVITVIGNQGRTEFPCCFTHNLPEIVQEPYHTDLFGVGINPSG